MTGSLNAKITAVAINTKDVASAVHVHIQGGDMGEGGSKGEGEEGKDEKE